MFQSGHFRDVHQTSHRLIVKDLTIGRENRREFKTQHLIVTTTNLLVTLDLLSRGLMVQARSLNNYWSSAVLDYLINLPAIKCNDVTLESFDVRTSDKLCIRR